MQEVWKECGFMKLNNPETHLSIRRVGLLALLAGCSLVVYLLASRTVYRLGFPLDDAWIHQTYARNLGQHGEMAFMPGQPSAGSTAPLWTGILAIGYVLHLGPYGWTFWLGWVLLVLLAWSGMKAFRALCPSRANLALWAGALLALEWHLAWAAVSGMETLLFAFLVLLTLAYLAQGYRPDSRRWLGLGMLVGLSTWVRPDGVTLIAPCALSALLLEPAWKQRIRALLLLGAGCVLLVFPYLAFNRALAGNWWPNTFFAKQAEYASMRQIPLWNRFLSLAALPLIGPGVILLPGFVLWLMQAVRRRSWGPLTGAAWLAGYFLLYAIRLPVTYQHGRYIMPAIPVYLIWSLAGMAGWVRFSAPSAWRRVLSRAWLASLIVLTMAFWVRGASAYASDVAVIESEMVATAHWVSEHTAPGAIIAAHDIGALGYFGGRPLLDLAGLVTPDVIPFIRDETQLAAYLDAQRADYLVTFPGWYPQLVQGGRPVFTTGGTFSPAQGGENMTVYEWIGP
jgi:hypothetical protein